MWLKRHAKFVHPHITPMILQKPVNYVHLPFQTVLNANQVLCVQYALVIFIY